LNPVACSNSSSKVMSATLSGAGCVWRMSCAVA
jgi:hypothetical protein